MSANRVQRLPFHWQSCPAKLLSKVTIHLFSPMYLQLWLLRICSSPTLVVQRRFTWHFLSSE